jgi:hypothetical protein
MQTYVADKVLNYGLIVAKASNKNEAMHLIMREFPDIFDIVCYDDLCESKYCLWRQLRELQDNEVVYRGL